MVLTGRSGRLWWGGSPQARMVGLRLQHPADLPRFGRSNDVYVVDCSATCGGRWSTVGTPCLVQLLHGQYLRPSSCVVSALLSKVKVCSANPPDLTADGSVVC
jgi:hypothetical protein